MKWRRPLPAPEPVTDRRSEDLVQRLGGEVDRLRDLTTELQSAISTLLHDKETP